MSQYMPSTATPRAPATKKSGSEAQPGMPDERSAKAATRATCGRRPLRCPTTTPSISAVITSAPAVASERLADRRSAGGGGLPEDQEGVHGPGS